MYNKEDRKQLIQDEENNYNFRLKFMIAAGGAIISLAILNIVLLAKASTTSVAVGASAMAASPIIPLIGMATLIIASLCVLPLLFSGNSTVYVGNPRPRAGFWGVSGWGSTLFAVATEGCDSHRHHGNNQHSHGNNHRHSGGSIFSGGNQHNHGNNHGHGGGSIFSASNQHNHGNNHGHGGGNVFGGGNRHGHR
ncbi:hypothetical protein [uncultured Legionella sp.]|uniref:hypothetical protein n=1 Tax=uncultured Legionella sp. TaxID=210934 RepID=UPI002609096E|nr:hypothetical protein [uncultured Legionella sp.]